MIIDFGRQHVTRNISLRNLDIITEQFRTYALTRCTGQWNWPLILFTRTLDSKDTGLKVILTFWVPSISFFMSDSKPLTVVVISTNSAFNDSISSCLFFCNSYQVKQIVINFWNSSDNFQCWSPICHNNLIWWTSDCDSLCFWQVLRLYF